MFIRPDDKPFMNNSIRKAIRKRNRIHYRAKSTNNPDHWSQYRHLRNDVIRLVRETKTEYKNKLTINGQKYPTRQMVENCQISL